MIAVYKYRCRNTNVPKSMDQSGEVANPARGQLSRKNEYFYPRSRLRTWSRGTRLVVPFRISLLILQFLLIHVAAFYVFLLLIEFSRKLMSKSSPWSQGRKTPSEGKPYKLLFYKRYNGYY